MSKEDIIQMTNLDKETLKKIIKEPWSYPQEVVDQVLLEVKDELEETIIVYKELQNNYRNKSLLGKLYDFGRGLLYVLYQETICRMAYPEEYGIYLYTKKLIKGYNNKNAIP